MRSAGSAYNRPMSRRKPRLEVKRIGKFPLSSSRNNLLLLLLFTVAFLIRLVYLLQIRSDPFFSYPLVDSRMYDLMAWDFARGEPLWKGAFFWPPLYPWFLGMLYSIFGHDYFAARVVQALLGALSCLLLYGIGRKTFGPLTGFIAAFAMAFCGSLIFFDGELLIPNLYIFLLLSALMLLLFAPRDYRRSSLPLWLAAGLTFGLAALARPNILLFIPFAALWGAGRNTSMLKRFINPALLLLGLLLAILPVTVRNYSMEGDFVLISSNGGINFYLGNNPHAEKTIAIRPGLRWLHLIEEAEREGHAGSTASSRYYFRKGLSFLRDSPGSAVSLMGKRFAHLWNSFEIGRNRDVYSTRCHSPLLSALLWKVDRFGFPFGLIAPLAVAGLIVSFRRNRAASLLYLFLLAYFLSILLFFATSRYRLPLVPILLLFASHYGVWIAQKLRSSGGARSLLLSLVPLAIAVPAINRGYTSIDRIYIGEQDRFLGAYHMEGGRLREAEEAFRRALSDDPDYADVHAELGRLLLNQARPEEALPHLERAVELCSYSDHAILLLARGYAAAGRGSEAETEYREAIRIAPHGESPGQFGQFLLREGRFAEAEEAILLAIRNRPRDLMARRNLIECYYRIENFDAMQLSLDEALTIAPGDSPIGIDLNKLQRLLSQLREGKSGDGAAMETEEDQ